MGDEKKNGTCGSSKSEDQMYKDLIHIFGKEMVKRNYCEDVRYPFHCDFYIVSHDIFIELNGTWFHGGHLFDETNSDDMTLLHTWETKLQNGHRAYGDAIKTWTVRDPLKCQTAKKHNLNYFVFWDNDLTDFHIWLQQYYSDIETNHTI